MSHWRLVTASNQMACRGLRSDFDAADLWGAVDESLCVPQKPDLIEPAWSSFHR